MSTELELIGVGCTRYVYADGDYVLKVPYNDCGKIQSENERRLYSNAAFKPYLAEVADYDHDTGTIRQERLRNCCIMRRKSDLIQSYFPEELLSIISGPFLQVGYDSNKSLKIFDYGLELTDKSILTEEQLDLVRAYRLPLK